MAVMMAREARTDERLDDLKSTVDEGFKDMRAEFRTLRQEMNEGRAEISAQLAAQNRMMYTLFGGMFATIVAGFLGVIAAIVTQG